MGQPLSKSKCLAVIRLVVAGLAMAHVVSAKCNNRARVLTVEELSQQFANYTVVDARDRLRYVREHIPQSVQMNWKEWTLEKPNFTNFIFGTTANWGKVPAKLDDVENRLRDLGLSQTGKIAVIGDGGGWGEEGRIAWNLLYWGAHEVALIDGGFPKWKEKFPDRTTTKTTNIELGTFKVQICSERLAEESDVQALVKQRQPLLDVRSKPEFKGKRISGQKRGGHLPGAELILPEDLYTADGLYLSEAELKQKLSEKALQHPVAYCVGGVRSALLAVLIEARLGIVAKNYAGSVWEWSSHPENPLISN